MKALKSISLIFIIIGIFFVVFGAIKYITTFNEVDDRIYTTATICRIDEYATGDSENPKAYKTYVRFNVDEEEVIAELNTYSSKYFVGYELEVYYFEDDLSLVYKKGSEHLLLIFPIVGTLFSVIGFVLLINKKVQNYLLKLPVSESI